MRRACLPFLSLPLPLSLSPHLSSDGGNHDISQEYSPFFQGFFFSMLAKYSQKQLGNPRKTSGQPVVGKGGRDGGSAKWTAISNSNRSTLHTCARRREKKLGPPVSTFTLRRRGVSKGSLYLYTTELGTTPPPELSTSRLLYIRFRQNRLKYYMIKRTKVHH